MLHKNRRKKVKNYCWSLKMIDGVNLLLFLFVDLGYFNLYGQIVLCFLTHKLIDELYCIKLKIKKLLSIFKMKN